MTWAPAIIGCIFCPLVALGAYVYARDWRRARRWARRAEQRLYAVGTVVPREML